MRFLFDCGMNSHMRHFESVVRELEARGHDLVMAATSNDLFGLRRYKVPMAGTHRDVVTYEVTTRADALGARAYQRRCARDYIEYLRPRHAGSEILRRRARNGLVVGHEDMPDPEFGVRLAETIDAIGPARREALDAGLEAAERALPADPAVVEALSSLNVDAILLTPLVVTQYGQADVVKAARLLSIPVIFLAGSWDNLTTKGMIHVPPDRTIVWNEIQKREAAEIHGLDPGRVACTGAPRFDAFMARRPETDRAEFLTGFGLDPERTTLLYLGSSNLIAEGEPAFVERWIAALRAGDDPRLREANVLLRPHPKFRQGWADVFGGHENVVVASSQGMQDDPLLYHSLVHSDLVVAVNTSAELEAAVVGKPVFTVLDDFFALGQSGTVHFGYLQRENGGIARSAHGLDDHLGQLSEELDAPTPAGVIDEFVKNFIRPMGLDRPATETTVDTIEAMLADLAVARPPRPDFRERIYQSYYRVHVAPRKGNLTPQRLEKIGLSFDDHFGKFLPQDKDAAIIDIGCGVGTLVHWLHSRGYERARGVDTSADVVKMARRMGIRNVIHADARDLVGTERNAYDVVIMRDVLEHLPKDAVLDILDLAHDFLKPGGRIVLQVPNGTSPLVGRILYGDFTHETAFTESSLSQVLLTCGFAEPRFRAAEPPIKRVSVWRAIRDRRARPVLRRWYAAALKRRILRFLIEAETGQSDAIVSFNMICTAHKPKSTSGSDTEAGAKRGEKAEADARAAKRKHKEKKKDKERRKATPKRKDKHEAA